VFHHLKNGCSKGSECKFSHDELTQEQKERLEQEQRDWEDYRKRII
jgi:hypothetical protein